MGMCSCMRTVSATSKERKISQIVSCDTPSSSSETLYTLRATKICTIISAAEINAVARVTETRWRIGRCK
ncbi:hypothetical protein ANTPLA_LOCUS5467 [Anthophora plagiata]